MIPRYFSKKMLLAQYHLDNRQGLLVIQPRGVIVPRGLQHVTQVVEARCAVCRARTG